MAVGLVVLVAFVIAGAVIALTVSNNDSPSATTPTAVEASDVAGGGEATGAASESPVNTGGTHVARYCSRVHCRGWRTTPSDRSSAKSATTARSMTATSPALEYLDQVRSTNYPNTGGSCTHHRWAEYTTMDPVSVRTTLRV
jgi:hypothetical protein